MTINQWAQNHRSKEVNIQFEENLLSLRRVLSGLWPMGDPILNPTFDKKSKDRGQRHKFLRKTFTFLEGRVDFLHLRPVLQL